jgi:hypothetical protein
MDMLLGSALSVSQCATCTLNGTSRREVTCLALDINRGWGGAAGGGLREELQAGSCDRPVVSAGGVRVVACWAAVVGAADVALGINGHLWQQGRHKSSQPVLAQGRASAAVLQGLQVCTKMCSECCGIRWCGCTAQRQHSLNVMCCDNIVMCRTAVLQL